MSLLPCLKGLSFVLLIMLLLPLSSSFAGWGMDWHYEIVQTYPHDPSSFTQGLDFQDGFFYEGTGLFGESSLIKIHPESGRIVRERHLPSQFFGEGITIADRRIIQLTWRSRAGFIYDRETFQLLGTFQYLTEGWGITFDGSQFIMSDGTATLRFLDAEDFHETRHVTVTDNEKPVKKLNELEFINGLVYANVWQTSRIAVIDPATGRIRAWIDLADVVEKAGGDTVVRTLNGIAYNHARDTLFVTGKYWPWIYEIRVKREKRVRS